MALLRRLPLALPVLAGVLRELLQCAGRQAVELALAGSPPAKPVPDDDPQTLLQDLVRKLQPRLDRRMGVSYPDLPLAGDVHRQEEGLARNGSESSSFRTFDAIDSLVDEIHHASLAQLVVWAVVPDFKQRVHWLS